MMVPLETNGGNPTPRSRVAALSFLGIVLLQGVHELEHIVQANQRFVFNDPKGSGILGSWLDIEPVHLVYNGALLLLIALTCYLGGFFSRKSRQRPLAVGLVSVALLFQSYHFVEHIFKMAQFIETGMNGTPGILGHVFNLVWLHLTYNTIVYLPLLLAFFLGGSHRVVVAAMGNWGHGRAWFRTRP